MQDSFLHDMTSYWHVTCEFAVFWRQFKAGFHLKKLCFGGPCECLRIEITILRLHQMMKNISIV